MDDFFTSLSSLPSLSIRAISATTSGAPIPSSHDAPTSSAGCERIDVRSHPRRHRAERAQTAEMILRAKNAARASALRPSNASVACTTSRGLEVSRMAGTPMPL